MATPILPADAALAAVPDEQLLRQVVAGDMQAFRELYDRFAPRILGITTRVLRDQAMAEEVTQEVLVELWRTAERFDDRRGSARAWVATVAHRRAVDRVRSEQAARARADRVGRRDRERAADVVAEEVELRLDHAQVRESRLREALAILRLQLRPMAA